MQYQVYILSCHLGGQEWKPKISVKAPIELQDLLIGYVEAQRQKLKAEGQNPREAELSIRYTKLTGNRATREGVVNPRQEGKLVRQILSR